MRTLQAELCCVAVGGGYVWAASNPDGVVWKSRRAEPSCRRSSSPSAIKRLTYADGALWAALGEDGNVVRIDPTTDATREYDVGHSVTGVDVRDGVVAAGVRESDDGRRPSRRDGDLAATSSGSVGRGDALRQWGGDGSRVHAPHLGRAAVQFHFATCARLLNYPDAEGRAGGSSRPRSPRTSRRSPTVDAPTPSGSGGVPLLSTVQRGGHGRVVQARDRARDVAEFDSVPGRLSLPRQHRRRRGLPRRHGAPYFRHLGGEATSSSIRLREPAPAFPWLAALSCAVPHETPVVPVRPRDARPFRWALLPRGAHRLACRPEAKSELRRNATAAPRRDRLHS